MSDEVKRRPGRPSGRTFKPYTVNLDEDTAEWARNEPEGISGVLRIALRSIKERRGMGCRSDNKLWLITPKLEGADTKNPWGCTQGEYCTSMVVSAPDEETARYVAAAYASGEAGYVWRSEEYSEVLRLSDGDIQGLVLANYSRVPR